MKTQSLLALVVFFAVPVLAQAPAETPFLRIETGFHSSRIWRLDTDASKRWLVTAAADKTARVWDLSSGAPVRILRPPIGLGEHGALYGIAISPDGSIVACGALNWEGGVSLYLFDRASGALLREVQGFPAAPSDLDFSPDGRHLAAGLLQAGGVRIIRVSDGTVTGSDSDYNGETDGVEFHPSGNRLAAAALDGSVRLYAVGGDGSLNLIARSAVPGGNQPHTVSHSPDGSRLAVGFWDSPAVVLLSSDDLRHLSSLPTEGMQGNLNAVAWSGDGRRLFAGGSYMNTGGYYLRTWDENGNHREFLASGFIIRDLRPLPNGAVVCGASDPFLAAFHPDGSTVYRYPAPFLNFYFAFRALQVSDDGTDLRFPREVFGQKPARFQIEGRTLGEDLPAPAGPPPLTEVPGLVVMPWEDGLNPAVNGRSLGIPEICRSLAIAPNGERFVLGTDGRLRCYDRAGNALWERAFSDAAWAVTVSGDSQLVVATLNDGTIRWYRLSDGTELLAFFPCADGRRWILWTPEGYYDCSPGAETLIGWHVNRGRAEVADFFPAAKFRETFYRPDVIDRILETRDEAAAVRLANEAAGRKAAPGSAAEVIAKMQPPVVELLSSRGEGETLVNGKPFVLAYRVRTSSGEAVTRVRALLDGRPLQEDLPVPAPGEEARVELSLAARDCVLTVLAENRFAVSEPATLRLVPSSPEPAPGPATPSGEVPAGLKPKLYLLAVGVSDYQDNQHLPDLDYAGKDASDFAGVFQRQEGGLYQKVEARVLTDLAATADEVLDGLDWIRQETTSKDVAIVFFAGHGENDEELRYHFCPTDYDPSRRLRTGVAMDQIQKTLASVPGKVMFFIDTCHAGNALGKLFASRGGGARNDLTRLVNELSSAENGAIVFASSTGRQVSVESADWENGAFTEALVEGLEGRADLLQNGKITVSSLETWVAERVKELSGGAQTPTVAKPQTIPDFPIAVKR